MLIAFNGLKLKLKQELRKLKQETAKSTQIYKKKLNQKETRLMRSRICFKILYKQHIWLISAFKKWFREAL